MPKLVFPMAAVVSNIINLLLSLIPLALLVPAMRHPFYWTWLYLPVPLLALTIFTLGMTFFFAAANVYYRDVSHILQVVLSAWFYVTPIIYSLDFIPAKLPLDFQAESDHLRDQRIPAVGVLRQLPKAPSIVASFVCAFVSLFIGFAIFQQISGRFCLLRLSCQCLPSAHRNSLGERHPALPGHPGAPDTLRELFSKFFRHNASYHDFEAVKNASLRGPARADAGADRAQRLGQEHAAEDHRRRVSADSGNGRGRRARWRR